MTLFWLQSDNLTMCRSKAFLRPGTSPSMASLPTFTAFEIGDFAKSANLYYQVKCRVCGGKEGEWASSSGLRDGFEKAAKNEHFLFKEKNTLRLGDNSVSSSASTRLYRKCKYEHKHKYKYKYNTSRLGDSSVSSSARTRTENLGEDRRNAIIDNLRPVDKQT